MPRCVRLLETAITEAERRLRSGFSPPLIAKPGFASFSQWRIRPLGRCCGLKSALRRLGNTPARCVPVAVGSPLRLPGYSTVARSISLV